jgi:mono/diheme cytochrome c family protein
MFSNATRRALTSGTGLTIFATLASATLAAGDAANGERIAQRWCVACHVVSPDQPRATTEAPTFASIAQRPGFDAEKLAFFLLEPHPKMPNMSLTRREAVDLAAYIAKLGQRQ